MSKRTTIDAVPLVGGRATGWGRVEKRLTKPEPEQTYWLTTLRPDGSPHVMPILGLWVDDTFVFITGAGTRKGKNLAHDGRCVIAGSTRKLPSLDFVIEGDARRVTDGPTLRRVVKALGIIGWPLEVTKGGVDGPNAPSAGPPPYGVYEVRPTKAFGLPGVAGMEKTPAKKRVTPTRWRFPKGR
jgi:hypothetical protein